MSLKTFVKISNVTNLSDARYCAGMMVDVIGFNIDSTAQSFVSAEDFEEITNWVAGVKFAGEFHGSGIEEIRNTVSKYPIDLIEIDDLNLVEKVFLLGKPLIVRLNINTDSEFRELKSTLSYLDELAKMVLIKSENDALFDDLDSQIGYYNGNLKLLKGYGVTTKKSIGRFPGLELEASKEERPGYKDYGQIMDVLEMIEED
ncbi:MAG: hypothetical protein ABJG47_14350 [Ekhidna sp.]